MKSVGSPKGREIFNPSVTREESLKDCFKTRLAP